MTERPSTDPTRDTIRVLSGLLLRALEQLQDGKHRAAEVSLKNSLAACRVYFAAVPRTPRICTYDPAD